MAARHTPTELGSRGRCKPSSYPATGQVPGKTARKHDAVERSVAHGRRTIRSRITFDVIPPTATKESLLKKVSEGYKRNPEKWSKLYHDLFPRLPIKLLNNLREERYQFHEKHAKRTLYPDVPFQMLHHGIVPKYSEYYLHPSLRKTYLAFDQKIQSIERKHEKRVQGLDALIAKLTRNKLARYEARRSEAEFLSSASSTRSSCDTASCVSTLASSSLSSVRRTPPSLRSISVQTDDGSISSFTEEQSEPPQPENVPSAIEEELREQLRVAEEQNTQHVLALQQAQFELCMLQEEKDNLLENESSARDELREQLRKAEEDKQQLILELQQTRFELCVLQDEKDDRLAKKKKGPLSFLRKKN